MKIHVVATALLIILPTLMASADDVSLRTNPAPLASASGSLDDSGAGKSFDSADRGLEGRPPLALRSITVDGKTIRMKADGGLNLGSQIGEAAFTFGPAANAANPPIRFRCQLDGHEEVWHERTGQMRLVIRFVDERLEQVGETSFPVSGQSAGWTGRFSDTPFLHQQKTLTVPPGAAYFWVIITSAGPPEAVGVYAVKNLVAFRANAAPTHLIPRLDAAAEDIIRERAQPPAGWERNGIWVRDARVVFSGPLRETTLAIVDEHADGHAEWNTIKSQEPKLTPGAALTLAWDEAYSIGMADYGRADYQKIPAGLYRFRMSAVNVMGLPGGGEVSVSVQVPVAFWKTSGFWMAAGLALFGLVMGGWRLVAHQKMKRKMKIVEKQRAVEEERVRIAQDIHDDLGALVTQISLVSSVAQQDHNLADGVRARFGAVSQMSQELVGGLYEVVWAVSPENDQLDSLASYVCQMAQQMCARAQLKCRLEVPDLPPEIPISSHIRHNIVMAVKESIHNIVRHAHASEIHIRIQSGPRTVNIEVADNGKGFDPATAARGNGLNNIEGRMKAIGGRCWVESLPASGTRICLELPLPKI